MNQVRELLGQIEAELRVVEDRAEHTVDFFPRDAARGLIRDVEYRLSFILAMLRERNSMARERHGARLTDPGARS